MGKEFKNFKNKCIYTTACRAIAHNLVDRFLNLKCINRIHLSYINVVFGLHFQLLLFYDKAR